MDTPSNRAKILVSALTANSIPETVENSLITELVDIWAQTDVIEIAQDFSTSQLIRRIRLTRKVQRKVHSQTEQRGTQIFHQNQLIGHVQVLYKSPLPGELQARLAIESVIDRFLDYLLKLHQIVVLNESDRHVQVFIPNKPTLNFGSLWEKFLREVAFSVYGNTKYQLPGLIQTFTLMLNAVTLSDRGFSKIDVPIVTSDQANVLAALYFAVFRDVRKRQHERFRQIEQLCQDLDGNDLTDKEQQKKSKELEDKEAMQVKEAQKYTENFQKFFGRILDEQNALWLENQGLQTKLDDSKTSTIERKKVQKQQDKLIEKIIFSQAFIQQKLPIFVESGGDPFQFLERDQKNNPVQFSAIASIAGKFTKTGTDQISSAKGDIFAICLLEMYRLLESSVYDPLPSPLLTEQPILPQARSPGDDSKEFCYSCGVTLEKGSRWRVARFMFERPYQRRQSGSSEDQPQICVSCSVLSFVSPLKVTDKSIILRLDSRDCSTTSNQKLKEYVRMLTNKDIHLSSGRYIVLKSDQTSGGDLASQKLGQIQFALAKVASIFPIEVLTDFQFSVFIQANQPLSLCGRHLIFIKGLMECYGQSIVISGKEINLTLGDALRLIQQDLPYLAEYTITKIATTAINLQMENVRELYWQSIQNDLALRGDSMNSETQLSKRAKLYRDVAALTGLTYAFASSLENTVKRIKEDDCEREVSKLIEKVDDPTAFCYYATLGVETTVQARLWSNPDNYFVYEQAKNLLTELGCVDREKTDDGKTWLQLYAEDISRAYTHFAENGYTQDREWKELTYNVKLSLYTRFPELVRKLKSTGDK
jgi:regulator of replication initiation timing